MSKKIKKTKRRIRTQHFQGSNKSAAQNVSLSNEQAIQLAVQHFQTGNLLQAEHLTRQLLNVDPDNAEANHLLGLILSQQGGKSESAIHHIRKAIQANPYNASFHHNLGLVFDKSGMMENAISSYRKALAINPEYAEAHNNLGVVLQEAGKLDEAEHNFKQALELKPDFADAHHNLGAIFDQLDRMEDAISSYRKALSINPKFAEAQTKLGDVLQKLNKLDEAVACYRKALTINPDYAEAHNNFGVLYQRLNRLDEAVACYRKALAINPDYAEAHNNLGFVYKDLGMMNEASSSNRKALAINPDSAEAHNLLGCLLQESEKLEDAMLSYKKALSLKPDFADAHSNLGSIYLQLGKIDEAMASFRNALSIDQEFLKSIIGLCRIVKFSEYDNFIQKIEGLYAEKYIPEEEKMLLGFTLGKVFADLKDYAKSFEFILEANRLRRKSYKYSIQDDHDFFERIKQTFSPNFFSGRHGSGCQDKTPIFVLGMMRSGTTLVEQILASHQNVFGAGELITLTNLVNGICSGEAIKQFPECIADISENALQKLGTDYIEGIRKHSKNAEYITDKMPNNFLHVGLIKLILPNAKVIHCMRNPMDNCLSIFKNPYIKGSHYYADDLTELGQYYNLYRSLMEHWEKVLPGYMYNLKYEEMVSDQENQTRKLLDYCGLPWDEECLAFHKTERRVNTISLVQVRQPIYKDSVDLWKRYEKQLEPLRKAIYGK